MIKSVFEYPVFFSQSLCMGFLFAVQETNLGTAQDSKVRGAEARGKDAVVSNFLLMCLQNPEHRHLFASSLSSPNFDVLRRPWVGLLDSEEKSHAELVRTKIGGFENGVWSQNELDFNVFNNWSNLKYR